MPVTNTSKRKIIAGSCDSLQITTTNQTTVLSYTVQKDDNYFVTPYIVVQNSPTSITLQLAWTDPISGAVTYNWYSGAVKGVGIYTLPTQMITAVTGSTVNVIVTASVANNVYLSAVIETGEW